MLFLYKDELKKSFSVGGRERNADSFIPENFSTISRMPRAQLINQFLQSEAQVPRLHGRFRQLVSYNG